jgi:hypothetical protein
LSPPRSELAVSATQIGRAVIDRSSAKDWSNSSAKVAQRVS